MNVCVEYSGAGNRVCADEYIDCGIAVLVVQGELKRLDNGSYQLRLSWTFQGVAPTSWRIRGFQEAHDPFTSNLQFNEVVERNSEFGDVTQFVSQPLSPGRRYLYEFDAIVLEPALNGSARLKTVTIDLREAI